MMVQIVGKTHGHSHCSQHNQSPVRLKMGYIWILEESPRCGGLASRWRCRTYLPYGGGCNLRSGSFDGARSGRYRSTENNNNS